MSASNYITSIPLFNGLQGKFYVVDGYKYHPCFPVAWAMNHVSFQHEDGGDISTGPMSCGGCAEYGCVRGVFVGYCANCLRMYQDASQWRGNHCFGSWPISEESDESFWSQYPYMQGVSQSDIGDMTFQEEGAHILEREALLYQLSSYHDNDATHIDVGESYDDSDDETVVPEYDNYDINDDDSIGF